MLRKNYFAFLLAFALLAMGESAVFAQSAPVRGKVELKKADGTTEPVAGAVIDVYRTDVKGKSPSNKTDKKGEFAFAGLPLGTFVFAVSAPNIKPEIYPNIRAGAENVNITVVAGDGKRYTEDEVRQSLNAAPTTAETGKQPAQSTAEQKKAQAEYEKQVADITAKNANSEKSNEIINRSLKEGNKAFEDKNFDLAIAKYDEGINAAPDFAGAAPTFLNNKAKVLIDRARDNYNQSVKADTATKTAAIVSVKKDLEDAAAASERALTILKSATAPNPADQKNYDANKFTALVNRKDAYRLLGKTGADRTKGKETQTAFAEYLAVETDAKRKVDTQLAFAEALQDANEFDLAITEFEKILANDPNNVDALAGISLSLVNVGYVSAEKDPAKGKEQLQQAANYLQKFLDVAPDTNKYKAEAKGIIETLKKEQSIAPQKQTKGTAKKKS